jgi:DNA-binding NarL/FixJ family response regulator
MNWEEILVFIVIPGVHKYLLQFNVNNFFNGNRMNNEKPYKILVVDDHPIVRDGIIHLIETDKRFEVCGATGDGNEVMSLIVSLMPDIVILDLTLESSDGLALSENIHARFPEIKILIVSMHNELTHAVQCIRTGARGYLMKKSASREIISAISEILIGKIYVSDAVKEQMLNTFSQSRKNVLNPSESLSTREFQIFRLYGQGMITAQISSKLNCSPKTVETHCYRIRRKLNLSSINELIAYAGAYMSNRHY